VTIWGMVDDTAMDLWTALTVQLSQAWDWAFAHPALTVALFAASFALVWLVEQGVVRGRARRRRR
jgi:hypothetical protein